MTKDDFIKKLLKLFEPRLSYQNDILMYRNDIKILIPETFQLTSDINTLTTSSICVYGNNELEILIKNIDSHSLENTISNTNYEIQINETISDKMCIKLIEELPNERIKVLLPTFRLERISEHKDSLTIFDFIKAIFSGYYSLKIKSLSNNASYIELLQLAKSFIFNISLLQNRNFYIVENVQNLSYDLKPNIRRIPRNNIDIPYRKYIDEVVQYYIDGNAARVPNIKFLSFYNVLEFYFDKVYLDDKCKKIQNIITNPKFNHNNLSHYKKILEVFDIKKAKNLEKTNITEFDSLKLLIEKYIDLNEFRNFLNEYRYYIENDAYKINDTKFSLSDSDENLISKISKRIYQIRNALVHSKDTENVRYVPRKDDAYIYNEIELIKYLAEEIIIATSDLIR